MWPPSATVDSQVLMIKSLAYDVSTIAELTGSKRSRLSLDSQRRSSRQSWIETNFYGKTLCPFVFIVPIDLPLSEPIIPQIDLTDPTLLASDPFFQRTFHSPPQLKKRQKSMQKSNLRCSPALSRTIKKSASPFQSDWSVDSIDSSLADPPSPSIPRSGKFSPLSDAHSCCRRVSASVRGIQGEADQWRVAEDCTEFSRSQRILSSVESLMKEIDRLLLLPQPPHAPTFNPSQNLPSSFQHLSHLSSRLQLLFDSANPTASPLPFVSVAEKESSQISRRSPPHSDEQTSCAEQPPDATLDDHFNEPPSSPIPFSPLFSPSQDNEENSDVLWPPGQDSLSQPHISLSQRASGSAEEGKELCMVRNEDASLWDEEERQSRQQLSAELEERLLYLLEAEEKVEAEKQGLSELKKRLLQKQRTLESFETKARKVLARERIALQQKERQVDQLLSNQQIQRKIASLQKLVQATEALQQLREGEVISFALGGEITANEVQLPPSLSASDMGRIVRLSKEFCITGRDSFSSLFSLLLSSSPSFLSLLTCDAVF